MMGTKVVSFRADEELLRYVRAKHLNPNEVAKEAFEAATRRLRMREALEHFGRHGVAHGGDATAEVRRLRDAR